MAAEDFSVLLPVYAGDRPEHLRRSFESTTTGQTTPPNQLVLVQDGPVDPALADTISDLIAACPIPVEHVHLPQNLGLAKALQAGLDRCAYAIVARTDADDICLPNRFEIQVPMVAGGFDIVGSAMREFEDDENCPGRLRARPSNQDDIAQLARFHSPFNHPSVVYRKESVQAAGGYRDLPFLEDYWLFARMIMAGARTANVPEPLVLYRVGSGVYARRGGGRMLRSDLTLQRWLRRRGFLSRWQYLRNVVTRTGYRLVPSKVRKWSYRLLRLG